ncbi:MAG: bifunctional (p)ppGpp synthetase/guanosine-3',5'-bis(diphosphate) 3'-pyrophosphohydrolase [Proteobacteria bacterium]|nr:bifunctional (p)ppGpp synthetase/guanosine-3',5'-bis(diphosphate) 3'-pyrophosphohydrolase [Pseudomonadota bacterium]
MKTLDDIIEKAKSYLPTQSLELIKKAYNYSAKLHKDQVRLSGEPYINHPVETAYILAELKMDEYCISAGLLHDVLEDTLASHEELAKEFGDEIAQLVDGVTKIGKIQFSSKADRKAENYRKMLMAMAKDIRVIIIKLADRLHNIKTLDFQPPDKREAIARETLEIYTPIANRLGMAKIKSELEDLSFRYIKPEVYEYLKNEVDKRIAQRGDYVERVKEVIKKLLADHNIHCEVSGRPKHLYSINQKMEKQKVSLDQIYDLIAFRIIVKSIKECYEVLGIIHSQWKPVPGRFKDYIAVPKPNMYQSLHTTVIGPEGERIEIQIRTEEMHRIAEFGIAAHWKYKEGRVRALKEEERFAWLRQILEYQKESKDAKDFIESIKTDIFSDEVYVFTPKGDVLVLPRGSTVVDFAYAIHSEVGNRCIGAKVNGKIVTLKYELQTGDIAEIITSTQQKPSADWLKFVKTSKAKSKIKQFIKQTQLQKSIEIGKELLDKALKKHDLSFNKLTKQDINKILKIFNIKEEEELYSQIGFGKLSAYHVVNELIPEEKRKEIKTVEAPEESPKEGIVIKELDGVLIKFAKCCNPLPGDPIVGFISRGKGITIHNPDCPNIINAEPYRIIQASWDPAKKILRPIKIRVECVDEPGLLTNISSSISKENVNISEAKISTLPEKTAVCDFKILVSDVNMLNKVMRSVEKVKGVYSVQRVK